MFYAVLLGLAHGCSTVQERVGLLLMSHECRSWTKNVHVRAISDQVGWGLPVLYFLNSVLPLRPAERKGLVIIFCKYFWDPNYFESLNILQVYFHSV